ncbi:MAG: hypothetical protein IKT98_06455 [Selenomonadaceae bacterium]|nr:hypothetical protein [Selenomonadaceae bacterium]
MELYKSEDIKAALMTQSEFGKLVGLSQQRISQLLDEQILIRSETSKRGCLEFYASIENYLLSSKTSGDAVNFWKERGLHEKAKRELAELKLSERKGELYEASTVEDFLTELIINTRNKFLTIPPKISRECEGKTAAQIHDIIAGEIKAVLMELSEGAESDGYKASAEELSDAAADDG